MFDLPCRDLQNEQRITTWEKMYMLFSRVLLFLFITDGHDLHL